MAPIVYTLTVSPGAMVLRSRQDGLASADPWVLDWQDERAWSVGTRSSLHRVTGASAPSGAGTKRAVSEWSRKSRLSMVRTLASLDWAGHVASAPAGWRPQMLTLTLPGAWERHAPTGRAFKALERAWLEKWRRRWGRRWAGSWKLEFQRRGAPHLHLYGNAPTGLGFRFWLSASWTEVVYGVDLGELPTDLSGWQAFLERVGVEHGQAVRDHLAAGTGHDWREGIRATDPKSVALYFLGKSVAHNVSGGKEYQHRVPELWQAPGAGPGRFWGHRGVARAEAAVELDDRQYVRLRRLVARWSRSTGRPIRAASWSRRQGWTLLHADAPAWLAAAARWAQLVDDGRRPRDVDRDGVRRIVGPSPGAYLP